MCASGCQLHQSLRRGGEHVTGGLCGRMWSTLSQVGVKCITYDALCVCVCVCLGGDLHYHLSQHGVFSEKEMRFYAAEIILGLEHMHNRFVVYRDLKVDL